MEDRYSALPPELHELIKKHVAATFIQTAWTRYSLYGHAKKHGWDDVRAHLIHLRLWPLLWKYSMVRREWRQEARSWLHTLGNRDCIIIEAEEGLWGSKTRWSALSQRDGMGNGLRDSPA